MGCPSLRVLGAASPPTTRPRTTTVSLNRPPSLGLSLLRALRRAGEPAALELELLLEVS
jgi:hypothetical protein